MSLRSTLCVARKMSAALTVRSTTKAKSRSTGWNAESSRTGRARVAFAFGSGIFSRITSKATSGPSASSVSSARGCNSPKCPSTFCGPIWIVPERPGWNHGGPPGTTWSACAGAPAAASTASASALASKASTSRAGAVGLGGGAAPRPPGAGALGARAPHAARRGQLVLRTVAAKDLSDLEQRHVGEAAVGVLLRRGDEPGNETRPHVGQVRRNGIGERKLGFPAAAQLGLRPAEEGPGHPFDHAARGERALGFARAQLDGREHWLARRLAPVEGRRRNALDTENANDLLHQPALPAALPPPRRNGDSQGLAAAGDGEAEMAEHALGLAPVGVEAGQPRQFVERKIDDARGYLRRARDHDLRGIA